ncbi:hypothetical protein N7508_007853 [Penicillium antarcticum]|uniref:uncharacterized protein n=1 Tax=Penicillium antarcticum TaxID=416450 RepID=UPI00238DA459|nr:uncharacterized protein N7508_007853 [Penicillium antarcticum]KAJ5297604.1 hypothetical protein N7508_007853 [Penicillium antarcticum]
MPVPTAELFDKQNEANDTSSTTNGHSHSSTEQGSNATYFTSTSAPASSDSSAQNGEGGRALTREEADRLYEERMEEEYAKRDGGA